MGSSAGGKPNFAAVSFLLLGALTLERQPHSFDGIDGKFLVDDIGSSDVRHCLASS